MPVDLTRPREIAAEKVLLDRCRILRDEEGTADDTFDPDTLDWGPPPNDNLTIATDLPSKFKHQVRGPGVTLESGNPTVLTEYEVSFEGWRLATDPGKELLLPGDWIEVLLSVYSPPLTGKWLRVIEPVYGTITVFQKARAVLRREGPQ